MTRMSKPDFSKRTRFPGTNQSSFATLLAILDAIDRMPAPVFAALLFGLCLAGTRGQGWQAGARGRHLDLGAGPALMQMCRWS